MGAPTSVRIATGIRAPSVFADSKRPGHLAGPYASTRAFLDDYTAYRGREIVSFRELPSYERTTRTLAAKRVREDREAAQ